MQSTTNRDEFCLSTRRRGGLAADQAAEAEKSGAIRGGAGAGPRQIFTKRLIMETM
jgi:hypothetical protein